MANSIRMNIPKEMAETIRNSHKRFIENNHKCKIPQVKFMRIGMKIIPTWENKINKVKNNGK